MSPRTAQSVALAMFGALLFSACRSGAPPETPRTDAVLTQSPKETLRTAGEIREAVQQYLSASPARARSHLPSDWAPKLPLEVGAVEAESDGYVRIGLWRLNLEGDQAQLDYYPPGSVNAHHRLWFRIQLARKAGGWEVLPPGVAFVHAWAKEAP